MGAVGGYFFVQYRRLFKPEVAVLAQDYATARSHFQTKLLTEGPSPQREVFVLRAPDYVDRIEYPSDGLHLKAWLARQPDTLHKLPAVLFLHGGFELGAADWDMAVPYWQSGFILMVPMLRGENGQPGTFSFLYDEVDDVLAAADQLAKIPGVDATRIFLAGHSAGGTLTLLAIEASPRFRAAASFDGSPDLQLLYHGSASKPGTHREVVFDPAQTRELEVRSPLAYVRSVRTPVRLYYSDEASAIIKLPSRRFVELAEAEGVDAAAVGVSGSHMNHVVRAIPQSIEFFRQSLGAQAALLKPRTVPPLGPSLAGNTTFVLRGHERAKVVALAGSFNGWDSQHVLCGKVSAAWVCRIDLPAGKYLYQFVVDDDWINDPDNPSFADSGNGGLASLVEKR
jgi:dipeptidyl aminopeptidase/acylaminoacyl peptidase